jgi:hypothetical protein
MAIAGIGSPVQNLENRLHQQTANSQTGENLQARENAGSVAITEDTSTPSSQNTSAQSPAQAAGIFQLSQRALSSVEANLPSQRATGNARTIGPPGPAEPGGQQQAAALNANSPTYRGQLFAPKPPGRTPASVPATANVQVQIQARNAALPALGLSKVEIQKIDSLAGQVQNFNPAAYTNRVNQCEALAKQSKQHGAPDPPANASNIGTPHTTTNTRGNGSGS